MSVEMDANAIRALRMARLSKPPARVVVFRTIAGTAFSVP
jgi:hypothetical protein